MADQYKNPILPEETKRSPALEEYDPSTAKQVGTSDPNASAEHLEPESNTVFSAIAWAHDFKPILDKQNQVLMTLLSSNCQGMIASP